MIEYPEYTFNIASNAEAREYIEESATRYYSQYLWLKEKRESNSYSNLKRSMYINVDLCNMTKYIKDKDHSCDKCGHEGNFENMLTHERQCLGFKEEVVFQKKVYSNETANCNTCDKVFYHTCKTSLPKHQLARHRKICDKTVIKRLRSEIQKKLNTLDLNDLISLKEYIQNT
tara:strand:+ start:3985 stop:4503 length:519 start_codon:yes stop_codon:yes gene_type:complete